MATDGYAWGGLFSKATPRPRTRLAMVSRRSCIAHRLTVIGVSFAAAASTGRLVAAQAHDRLEGGGAADDQIGRDTWEFAQAAEEIGYHGIAAPDHVLGANIASRPGWTQLRGPIDRFLSRSVRAVRPRPGD